MSKKKDHKDLYYLFPVSRKGSRDRYFRHLLWSFAVGIIFAIIVGAAIYLYNTH